MAVSKHNQWKRQKNGLMKLVRSHGEWLEKRRERKMRELGRKRGDMPVEGSKWLIRDTEYTIGPVKADGVKSVKRTQVGKKI